MMFRITRHESERSADEIRMANNGDFKTRVSALMGKQVKASSPLVDSSQKTSDGRADR